MEAKGSVGHLPVWVTPEQVRVLTVADSHLERAGSLVSRIDSAGIRVGLDDRSETVSKKVRGAKQDWVSYVVVVGDKELSSDRLTVYERASNKNIEMTVDGLVSKVRSEIGDKPFKPLYMPKELSKRVDF
jgi:threonyl-tRNA synthetase